MMTSRCKRIVYLLLASSVISSCAIQPGQETVDEEPVRTEVIVVDEAVQKNFDSAIALMKQEKYNSAIDILNNVVASEKRLTAPYIDLAIAYQHTGEDNKAQQNLEAALAVDKYDPVANNALGLMLRKQGKFEDARKAYTSALKKNPEYLPVIKNLGILCDIYLRDWDCALEQFERYHELQPDKQVKIWIADLKRRAGG